MRKKKLSRGKNLQKTQVKILKLLVKKDAEYRPVYNEAEQMDYKNLECFQYAKKGQILAEIIKEEDGISGRDVLGGVIFASKGKKPLMPIGKNTQVNKFWLLWLAYSDWGRDRNKQYPFPSYNA